MKFRFINANEPVTTFYRDIVPYFVSQGHEVDVLTSKALYRGDRDLDEAIGHLKGVRVVKTAGLSINDYSSSVLSKALVRGLYAVHGFFLMLFGKQVDKNVFLTQPPFFYSVGPILRFFRKEKYYCVVMDVQPQQYNEFGIISKSSLLSKALYKLSSWGLRNADGIIVIGRCMSDIIESMGVDKNKISFIPNWTTEEKYTPVAREDNEIRLKNKWEDKFIISYGGNIGFAQNFDSIIDAANKLKHNNSIMFLLVGGGGKVKELKEKVNKLGLSNFIFMPYMHGEYSLSTIYGAGDINFISLKESCTGLGVPSKAYVSLASGRPILYQGSKTGEIARMIIESKIGAVVSDTQELVDTINIYYKDPSRCIEEGKRARDFSEKKYSAQAAISSYLSVLSQD